MKTNFKLGLVLGLGLSIQALVQFTAFAGDYPMSGQDTVLKLNGRATLSIVDKDGNEFLLNDGGKYRFRMSNHSQSFHLMSGNREQQEFKLQNGFPGGDLRNFTVKGEEWGNPGITLNKNTYTTEISVSDQVQTSGCSFVCGQDYFCRNVIQRQCMPTRREVCDIGRRNCHFVNDVVCQDISMRVCGYETRFCSGTETYTEHYSTTEDRQDFKLIDETTSEQMGLFRDLEASHSNSYRVNTLRSCR